jgi:DNA-binding NarL/FixJ family response regulator
MRLFYESVPEEEIAEQLFISVFTVRRHKHNALERLGVHSLSEFISYASQHRLFDDVQSF